MVAVGRPKMKDEKKKVQFSCSLSKSVIELAEKTENKSHFIDTSVQCSRALAIAVKALRDKTMSLEEAMVEIEDIADVWAAEFEESEVFETVVPVATTKQFKRAK